MSHRRVNAKDLIPGRGPHPAGSPFDKRVSEPLGLKAFEMYKVELPPGESTKPHDHLDDNVEDAYAIVRGSGWLVVNGNETPVSVGDFIAVSQHAERYVKAGDGGCDLIAVCA